MTNKALDLTEEILAGRHYAFGYVAEEVRELLLEILRLDFAAIREERQDVAYALQMWAYQRMNWNLPVLFADDSIRKFRERIETWKAIFAERQMGFHVDYLIGGANFTKPHKVVSAFRLAGVNLDSAEAAEISRSAAQG